MHCPLPAQVAARGSGAGRREWTDRPPGGGGGAVRVLYGKGGEEGGLWVPRGEHQGGNYEDAGGQGQEKLPH